MIDFSVLLSISCLFAQIQCHAGVFLVDVCKHGRFSEKNRYNLTLPGVSSSPVDDTSKRENSVLREIV